MFQSRRVAALFLIIVSLLLLSCAAAPPPKTKQVKLVTREIPPPNTKVYADPKVDWSKFRVINVDLQQIGAPERSRNQILERYLIQQAKDCFERKGYVFSDAESSARVRIYFEAKQLDVQSTSVLAYGFVDSRAQGSFLTEYSLASGTWRSSTVAAARWDAVQISNAYPVYEGKISIEVFDSTNTHQLWRGDVSTTLSTDDIRVASNTLIRELLWYFPALDYPAVWVPEVRADEFPRFKDWALLNREFYSPGQRTPISIAALDDSLTMLVKLKVDNLDQLPETIHDLGLTGNELYSLRTRYLAEFEETPEFETLHKKKNPWTDQNEERRSKPYLEALDNFITQKLFLVSGIFGLTEIQNQQRNAAAIADLLYTAPWSIQDSSSGNIFVFGRYFVGNDVQPTTILITASPVEIGRIRLLDETFAYHRYVIMSVLSIAPDKYEEYWERADRYREMAVGLIDLNAHAPSVAENPKG